MIKNSIVKRWAFSVLAGIIIVIIAIGVAIGFILKEQYYNSVEMTLNSRANAMVLSNFNSASAISDENFIKVSKNFVDNFSDKNIMEVWVIDKNGNVVVSSTGFSVKGESYPDYDYAKASDNHKGFWTGEMQSGEKVMAMTYVLPQSESGVNGAVRYIISLEDVDKQIVFIWIVISMLLVVFILFVVTSGAFFINSIINRKTNSFKIHK